MGSGESFGDRTVADAIVLTLSIRRAGCYRDEFAGGNGPENYFSHQAIMARHSRPKPANFGLSAPIHSTALPKQRAFPASALPLHPKDQPGPFMQPHDFWQILHPAETFDGTGPFAEAYPARLADGRQLLLPIRALADGRHGLASLIVNQASFSVLSALADDLAGRLRPFAPDIVVGLPTLGLTLAAAVAERLGHTRYVPCGTSRKFWYVEELSVPMSSVTTHHVKRLYIDPSMLPLLDGHRVALVDDVLSSGTSMVAGLRLMATVGVEPVAVGAAMLQTDRWRSALADLSPVWPERVVSSLSTPLLERSSGWVVAT